MKTKFQTLLMVLILSASTINAATIYVDHSASGNNDGSTWTDAFTVFQDALDMAASGDKIWAAKGVYLPTTKIGGTSDRTRAFQMLEGVTIYGGFAGTEAAVSERMDYTYGGLNETTLSGDFNADDVVTGSGSTLAISNNSENSYHLFNHPSGYALTATAILDGFTLKGGNANGSANPWNDGGAIYNSSGQAPTINNCYFIGNEAKDNGACIVNAYSANATITNCSFITNLAGGGTTEGGAGGIFNYQSSPQITNCLFYGNRVSGGTNDLGGAIYNNNASNPTITNSTIVGNYARSGGGIYNTDNSDATVINCIIWGNTIGSGVGTQIRNYTNSNLALSYTDIEGGIAGGIYSSSGGSTTDGGGNINSDPKFAGSSLNANHPFSIWGDSPCADVGSDVANTETYDIRGFGFDRKLSKTDGTSGTIDMGSYEYKFGSDPTISGRYYVNDDATGNNNGTSWANAFTSFQSALDVAVNGDEIWVAAGTYKPSYGYNAGDPPRYYHFEMINGVVIYGGFAGSETAISQRMDFGIGSANETILSGDIGTEDDNSDNCYHVIYNGAFGLDATAIIDGFSITKGNADGTGNPWNRGGGMYNAIDSPTIINCTFSENTASDWGGGMYNASNSPTIINCTFYNNTATSWGGGIFNYSNSAPVITNCLFTGNSSQRGGGMFNQQSSPIITNCTFTGNTSEYGAGINNNSLSSPIITNSILWGNLVTYTGQEMFNSNSTPTISYSDVEGDLAGIAETNGSSTTDGGNNIDSDPLFVGYGDFPYLIYGNSPCTDVGQNTANAETTDIRDGSYGRKLNRIDGSAGTIDMGTYEYKFGIDPAYPPVIFVVGNATGDDNGLSWANAYASFQSALNEVVAGQEIWVAKGTYQPSQEWDGTTDTPREFTFRMIYDVSIYGGFAGTETAASQRTDYGVGGINETILSGDKNGDDVISGSGATLSITNNNENCYHIFYHPNLVNVNTAILDGFTISGGNADGSYPHSYGSGMFNDAVSPIISNCVFTGNSSLRGGGIYNKTNSSTSVSYCTFSKNSSEYGGGIYIMQFSSPDVTNCIFSGNYASAHGGGIYIADNSSINITSSYFTGNYAVQGGGMLIRESNAVVTNCVFTNNEGSKGGGMNIALCSPSLINCTFTQNSAWKGGGIYTVFSSSTPNISNAIIWGNTASGSGNSIYNDISGNPSLSYCDIEGSGGSSSWDPALGTDGGNNIDADPLFVGSGNHPYLIYGNSPCADAGDYSATSETTDIRGGSYGRKLNKTDGSAGTIDMGAYEYKFGTDPAAGGITITWDGSTDTDWNTASNWSSNTIPTSIDNVIIPDVINEPVIAASASGDCNDLTIQIGASLTIQSNATGTGTLITNGTITNGGTVNAQRYFSGNDLNWHLASSPMSNSTANVFYDMYLQSFDESSNDYNQIIDETTPMNVMEGYALYSTLNVNNTVTFTGDLNTGSISRAFTAGNVGWNLMGNPYPSSIDWESVTIPTGMGNEIQYLEASTGNWQSYVQGVGGTGSQYIPPMQGFFVKASTTGTFALDNSDRSHNGSNFFYKNDNPNLLILSVSNETYSDETWIHFNENAGEEHDGVYDAFKMISTANPELPQIYSITPLNEMLSINGLPQTETVALGFTAIIPGTFTINASKLMESSGIMLEDLKTGEFTDLAKNDYTFSFSMGENPERFMLHFQALGLSENGQETANIYSSGKDIYVSLTEEMDGNISVYNVTGQLVVASKLTGMNNKVTVEQSGIYIVMLNSKKKTSTKKVFVK